MLVKRRLSVLSITVIKFVHALKKRLHPKWYVTKYFDCSLIIPISLFSYSVYHSFFLCHAIRAWINIWAQSFHVQRVFHAEVARFRLFGVTLLCPALHKIRTFTREIRGAKVARARMKVRTCKRKRTVRVALRQWYTRRKLKISEILNITLSSQ